MEQKYFSGGLPIYAFLFLFHLSFNTFAQVGIGNTNPDQSSLLEIGDGTDTNDKGVLIPRVKLTNLTSATSPISSPATGLMVYNTEPTTGLGFFYWNGTRWMGIDGEKDWKLDGNAGTNAATDFLGTIDNTALQFRTRDFTRFEITSGNTQANGGRLRAFTNGNATQPVYSWNTSPNMGLYALGTNILGFSTNSAERMRIAANGDVAVGNGNPLSKLHVTLNQNNRPSIYSEITVSNSNWSGGEFYNPNYSGGIGVAGTGYYGVNGQSTFIFGWAGYFEGDVGAGDYYILSDERWKSNIVSLKEDKKLLKKVLQLKPKSYNWKTVEFPSLNKDPNKKSYGFIAQEMMELFPELVESKNIPDPKKKRVPLTEVESVPGYYMVNYTGLIPILTEAIQEQQHIIDLLETRIANVEILVQQLLLDKK